MSSELKAYAEKLRQEKPEESPAAPGDCYPFNMTPYSPPKEIRELGRIRAEAQKIAKEQFLNSQIKFQ
ncbi:MAG: hypothetical protein LBK06_00040 [Planctomycetaceae bacterium]|jgi:hypothetical protein|nr:hypothetical protein [Planctomycetaceae bacterium]